MIADEQASESAAHTSRAGLGLPAAAPSSHLDVSLTAYRQDRARNGGGRDAEKHVNRIPRPRGALFARRIQMRILAAGESVSARDAVVRRLSRSFLRGNTSVRLVGVVHSEIPRLPDPAFALVAAHEEQIRLQRLHLPSALAAGAACIARSNPTATVTWKILEGRPADVILEEAERWHATAIVVGDTDRHRLVDSLAQPTAEFLSSKAWIPVEVAPRSTYTLREPSSAHSQHEALRCLNGSTPSL